MSDQSSDAESQADGEATSPDATASEPQAGSTSSSDKAADQESADARIARLEAELAQTRKEAAARRVEAKNAKQRADELEQAGMTEQQKAQKRADEAEARAAAAEAKLAEAAMRSAVYAEAEKLKAVAPSDVYAIVRDEITAAGDDADIPLIVKDALDARPHLIRQPASSGAAANGARDQASGGVKSDAEWRQELYGGAGAGIFDAENATRRGGGVQIPGGAQQVERRN